MNGQRRALADVHAFTVQAAGAGAGGWFDAGLEYVHLARQALAHAVELGLDGDVLRLAHLYTRDLARVAKCIEDFHRTQGLDDVDRWLENANAICDTIEAGKAVEFDRLELRAIDHHLMAVRDLAEPLERVGIAQLHQRLARLARLARARA